MQTKNTDEINGKLLLIKAENRRALKTGHKEDIVQEALTYFKLFCCQT